MCVAYISTFRSLPRSLSVIDLIAKHVSTVPKGSAIVAMKRALHNNTRQHE